MGLILFSFITGNSSLEPLLEGLLAQIHFDLSWRIFDRNRTGDLRIAQICWVPRSCPLSYGDGCITGDPSGPSKRCSLQHTATHYSTLLHWTAGDRPLRLFCTKTQRNLLTRLHTKEALLRLFVSLCVYHARSVWDLHIYPPKSSLNEKKALNRSTMNKLHVCYVCVCVHACNMFSRWFAKTCTIS